MNWMPVREFLRGGYREITEPTVISNHGRPVFTVFPHTRAADSSRDPGVVVRSTQGDSDPAPPRSAGVPEV